MKIPQPPGVRSTLQGDECGNGGVWFHEFLPNGGRFYKTNVPKHFKKLVEDIKNLKEDLELSDNEFRNYVAEIKTSMIKASEGKLIYSEKPELFSVCVMQRNDFVLEIRLSNANQGLSRESCIRVYFTEPEIIDDCLLYLSLGSKPYVNGNAIQDSQIDCSAKYADEFEIEFYRSKI